METPGRASLRSLHLQVITLGIPRKCRVRIMDVMNAFLRADGSRREEFLRATVARGPGGTYRIRKLHAPAMV